MKIPDPKYGPGDIVLFKYIDPKTKKPIAGFGKISWGRYHFFLKGEWQYFAAPEETGRFLCEEPWIIKKLNKTV